MKWLRYTLTPRGNVSAGSSRETGNDRAVYDVLPGAVIRGALGSTWWQEEAGDQAAFDALFASSMSVHAAIPSVDGETPALNPLGWSRAKYPADSSFEPVRPGPKGDRVAGRGWAVPGDWMTATTRTGLVNGVAEDGILYTRRASRASVVFTGLLALDDAATDAVVTWLTKERGVSIGGQRSIMGRCRWTCERIDDPFPAPASQTVALTALQPVILVGEFGANSLDLAAAIHSAAPPDTHVEVIDTVIRPVTVGGWHGRAGFPKPMEWALDGGSWALIETDAPDQVWPALRRGLGVRRNEGYGAVALTAPDARPTFDATVTAPTAQVAPRATASPEGPAAMAAEPAGASPADEVRALVLRIPEADRPTAVRRLLDLAKEIDAIARRPMGGPRIAPRIEQAKTERWQREIPPDIVGELLNGLKPNDRRATTIQVLEAMR